MHQSPSFDTLVFAQADIKLVKRSVTVGLMNSKLGCVVRMVVDSILPHVESGPNDHRKDTPPFNRNPFLIFNSIFGCDIKLIIIFFIISFSTTNAAAFFQIFNMQSGMHGPKIRSMDPCSEFENLFLLSLSTNLPIFSYFSLVFWK